MATSLSDPAAGPAVGKNDTPGRVALVAGAGGIIGKALLETIAATTRLTYDYRGIGFSRPERLRGCTYRWRDWGTYDVEAALRSMQARRPGATISVVGHSIGGFLPGLAPSATLIARMLTVAAQYAWWGDYAPAARLRLFAKWHVAMPVLTALFG